MKKVLSILLVSLFNIIAFSAPEPYFYECSGLADIEEYRVGINLNSGKAGFFDNEVISYMKLTSSKKLETYPPQTQMIFEGKDLGGEGNLKLYFNVTKKSIALYSINKKNPPKLLGAVSCVHATPWSELE